MQTLIDAIVDSGNPLRQALGKCVFYSISFLLIYHPISGGGTSTKTQYSKYMYCTYL